MLSQGIGIFRVASEIPFLNWAMISDTHVALFQISFFEFEGIYQYPW